MKVYTGKAAMFVEQHDLQIGKKVHRSAPELYLCHTYFCILSYVFVSLSYVIVSLSYIFVSL